MAHSAAVGSTSVSSHSLMLNRAGAPRAGFSWSMPKKPHERAVHVANPTMLASHPKMADASKMHELNPGEQLYMAMSRVNKHSVIFDPPLETSTGRHMRKHKPGVIPGRPDWKPKGKFLHNAEYGGFAHVRPLDDMLAERDARRAEERKTQRFAAKDSLTVQKDTAAIAAREEAEAALSLREKKSAQARMHIRKQQLLFAEADENEDYALDEDEFRRVLSTRTLNFHSSEEIQKWYHMADVSGTGQLTMPTYFLWSIVSATHKTGVQVRDIFNRYDKDGSGVLDELEFGLAVEDMGYGDHAHLLFSALNLNDDRTVSYPSITDGIEHLTDKPSKEVTDFLTSLAANFEYKRDLVIDDSAHKFDGDTPEAVRVSLLALLEREKSSFKLSDLFREMDDDGSNLVSASEFSRAFEDELKFVGDVTVLTQIFEALDGDNSGRMGFSELQAWLRGKKTTAAIKLEAMSSISLASRVVAEEDAWDEARLQTELKQLFESRGLLAADVVRAWAGEDFLISKTEFLTQLKALVADEKLWYSEVRGAVTDAFDTIDSADDGAISVVELSAWLEGDAAAYVSDFKPAATRVQAASRGRQVRRARVAEPDGK